MRVHQIFYQGNQIDQRYTIYYYYVNQFDVVLTENIGNDCRWSIVILRDETEVRSQSHELLKFIYK